MNTRLPSELGGKGERYVFFKSLLEKRDGRSPQFQYMARKTAWMGQDYISKQSKHGGLDLTEITMQIEAVIAGIKVIADSEYDKEKAYIDSQKSKLDSSIFKINFPNDPNGDWAEFITLLNFARGNGEDFFQRVREERDRIKENQDYIKEVNKKIRNGNYSKEERDSMRRGYKRTKQYKASEYLVPLVKKMFGGKSNKNSYANIIKDYIVQTNWQSFLSVSGGSLVFDEQNFCALVFASVQVVMEELVTKSQIALSEIFDKGEKKSHSYETRMANFTEWIENEDNKKLAGLDKVRSILDSAFAKKMITTNFQRKMVMNEKTLSKNEQNKKNKKIRTINKEINRRKNSSKESDKDGNFLNKVPTEKWLEVHAALHQPSGNWLFTELQELIINTANDEMGVSLGDSSVKTDNAFISVSFDLSDTFYEQIEDMTQKAYASRYSSFENDPNYFEGDVSTENWKHRQEALENYTNDLTRILQEEQNIKDLSSSFIIESSSKIYESYLVKTGAFSGGSLGPNLDSQLAKIDELARSGGLDIGDINWLKSAIINTHPSTLGAGMKGPLENYLSMIATALLFDDGVAIMKQNTDNMLQGVSSSSVNKIHLFYLQGMGYYPLSQLLYHFCSNMQNAYGECLPIAEKGGGVKTSITFSGFPQDGTPYKNLSLDTWAETGKQASAATLLKMTILGSFLDVLNGLVSFGG